MAEKEPLTAAEFSRWLRNCTDDALARGLPLREIFMEVLNLVRRLIIDMLYEENRLLAVEQGKKKPDGPKRFS